MYDSILGDNTVIHTQLRQLRGMGTYASGNVAMDDTGALQASHNMNDADEEEPVVIRRRPRAS